ncbi:hypothetical protein P7C70_g7801, partial [Phenoliferia sp. Uapishka_3]
MSSSPYASRSHTKRPFKDDDSDFDEDDDNDNQPALKKRGQATGPVDKKDKKAQRMHRNRLAAQASRDRKKAGQQILEQRVAELEAQLAQEVGKQSCVATASLSALVPPPALATVVTVEGLPLEAENEALRSQLHEEQIHSAALKARLGQLEDKFSRLEALFSAPIAISSTPSSSDPIFSSLPPIPLPSPALTNTPHTRGIPAAEAIPFDNVISGPSEIVHPADSSSDSLLDLNFDSSFLDQPQLSIDESAFANAWADWEQGLSFPANDEQEPAGGNEGCGLDMDLFSYLQDAAISASC